MTFDALKAIWIHLCTFDKPFNEDSIPQSQRL